MIPRLRTVLASALTALALFLPSAAVRAESCNVAAVEQEVQQTLIGGAEVSSLHIVWATESEGPDLLGYEVWSRGQATAKRLGVFPERGHCGSPTRYDVVVDYDPTLIYYLEIHATDGSIWALPVRIRGATVAA